jgi:long-chain acyl-CoA synthetase
VAWEKIEMSLNLAHFLDMNADADPDHPALILDEFRLSYGETVALVKRVANVLADMGVHKGDKVALMVPNTPHFTVIYYAILSVGATVVPVNVLYKAHEIQYYLDDSEAKVFFAFKMFFEEAAIAFELAETCHHLIVVGAPNDFTPPAKGESFMQLIMGASTEFDVVETMPDDTAVILYTSGTTGHPKGAELTHFNIFFNAFHSKEKIALATKEDTALAILPLFHSFGQTCIQNTTMLSGGTMTMLPRFETERTMQVIQRDHVTIFAAVPTMYFFILNLPNWNDYDLSSMRMCTSGGAAMPVEVMSRWKERYGVQILEGYGLSETSPIASFNRHDRPAKPGSIGFPIWGVDMRIMREDGSFAKTEEVGEIVIKGHNIMKGYYKKPAATEEAIVNGWFHSGDMGKIDNEGYFFIVDRKKDLIIRGGMNIYPREVEEVLYAHPAVLEASVVGIPDVARGEEVKAFISLRDGMHVTVDELNDYCKERMAGYKCPKEFEIMKELPKGPTGKILKRELRDAARAGK